MTQTRLLRHALALGIAAASLAIPSRQGLEAQQKHGDVSADGVISALDAQAILSHVVGLSLPPNFVIGNGDANCDTGTGALDAQIVLSYVIGLNVAQYCVGKAFGPGATIVKLTPTDTSVLINRGLRLRALLTDDAGNPIERPVTWATTNADLVRIDSARGDTAWVSNKGVAFDATATITAHADGTFGSTTIKVFRSYAGIVIQPQRGDTMRQLNGTRNFTARLRDSVGVIGALVNANWTTADPLIASVPTTVTSTGVVTALSTGTTWLYATQQTNPAVKDSVPVTVFLPPQNACTGNGGTLHPAATFTTPQVWSAATNPHYVTGQLTFNAGSKLTVEPGTLVCLNTSAYLYFNNGSRLSAQGTAAQPIRFENTSGAQYWGGLWLGQNDASATPPTDTSLVTYTTFSGSYYGVYNYQRHVVTLDNVTLRDYWANAVTLHRQGSTLIRSRVDTGNVGYGGSTAVVLYRGAIEESALRLGGVDNGIQFHEAGTARQVTIDDPVIGIAVSFQDSARINDVVINRPSGTALEFATDVHPASGNVQIVGGTGGAYRGSIQNLGVLFPDSLKQETLKGHGNDTVYVTGGTLTRTTLVTRPDLPWRIENWIYVDTLGVLAPRPGTRFVVSYGGFYFQRGGKLNAIGESGKRIHFAPTPSGYFTGLEFSNPGPGPTPSLAPVAVSTLSYVRVDSATGTWPSNGLGGYGAIHGANRHRLIIDNAYIRKPHNGAIYMAAPNSELRSSQIDTTGTIESNYVAGYPAVALGDTTLVQDTRVLRSGQTGIWVAGGNGGARIINTRVVGSLGAGIHAEAGILSTATTGVRADSANGYPFRGRIENLAVLAPDSTAQATTFIPVSGPGNVDNYFDITGGALRGTIGVHTPASPLVLTAIPQIRWLVRTYTYIDTLSRFAPRPGAQFRFTCCGFYFRQGGHLEARGEAGKRIVFRPEPTISGATFYALQFDNPGPGPTPSLAPVAVSTLQYVQLDSASGDWPSNGLSGYAAIHGANRHRLLIDSAYIRKAHNGAIYVSAPGSEIKSSRIDTTGTIVSNYVASYPAIGLGDTTLLQDTRVLRSGQTGVWAPGGNGGQRLVNVRVAGSLGIGVHAENGILASVVGLRADSANALPFRGRIENLAIIAPDSAAQATAFIPLSGPGNVDNYFDITGGTLRGTVGTHTPASPLTLTAIPQIRWLVRTYTYIDTLSRFAPRPGSQFRFTCCGFYFRQGGHLEARGEIGKRIVFRPEPTIPSAQFYGLQFDNPGAGAGPTPPTATSTLNYVQVDSASGEWPGSGLSGYAAIHGANRHKLLIDSAYVRRAHNGAIYMAAPGSALMNSRIDTTGTFSSGFIASYPAVGLGDTTVIENTRVLRSGQTGVWAPGTNGGMRLTNIRVVGSVGIGIHAEAGRLDVASSGVRADSANAYPFRGKIENLYAIAPDSTEQANSFLPATGPGNTDNMLEIAGGTLMGTTAPISLTAIPQLRWQVTTTTYIDTLAVFAPRPASLITFRTAGFQFQRGGYLDARGESGKRIVFRPASVSGSTFNGLQFENPGPGGTSPVAVSTLNYVNVDSASGVWPSGGYGYAAISAADRHRVSIDSARLRKSHNGAVYMAASGSTLNASLIDTTGTGAGFTTGYRALWLRAGTSVTGTTVRRSGHDAFYVDGSTVNVTGSRAVSSLGIGYLFSSTTVGGSFSGFTADSSGGVGVSIQAANLTFTNCDVLRGASHGFATTTNFAGIVINNCNIGGDLTLNEQNLGQGVVQFTGSNFIDATLNWWGVDGAGAPITPTLGGVNGYSGNVNFSPILNVKRVP